MTKERIKLTKDLFEAGDVFKIIKSRSKVKKNKKKFKLKKQYKILENESDFKIKRENTQIAYEQSNAVIIWSVINKFFPKVIANTNLFTYTYIIYQVPSYITFLMFIVVNLSIYYTILQNPNKK